MEMIVTIHAAKTNLSRLIEQACAGEDVIIARGAQPVVKLVPVGHEEPVRKFGALKGTLTVTESFFEPLPDAELGRWE
jgi:prevent-host-death family protein